jgi:hypothetical protein
MSRCPLGDAVSVPKVLIERLDGLNSHGLKILSARKPFPRPEPLGWSFAPSPWHVLGVGEQNRGLIPMLQGTLCLLHDGSAKDALQSLEHLTDPISGG